MSWTFLSGVHFRTWEQASCKYTNSSRWSHDKLHRFLVMVLPEVEKRRSGVTDVAGITSTRRARRESHGKIFTPRRHSLRGLLVFGSRMVQLFQTWISLLVISTLVRCEVAWWAKPQWWTWNLRYRCQCGSDCARPPHLWLHWWTWLSDTQLLHNHQALVMFNRRNPS